MALAASVQSVRLWAAGAGGTPAGNEASLIAAVRKRFNLRFANLSRETIGVVAYVYGATPLVLYLKKCLPAGQFGSLSAERLGDLVFDGFKLVATRTRIPKRYAHVLESDAAWQEVIKLLDGIRNGNSVQAPELEDDEDLPDLPKWTPSVTVSPPW